MPIIKKLIIKEWLKAFLGTSFVLFFLVFTAGVVSELLRDVTTLMVIVKHTILQMPIWFSKILPVACLTGSLFSLNKLQNRNELIAIFVCGLYRRSFIFLIFQLSFMVALLQLANNAYVIPYAKVMQWVWMKDDAIHFRENKKTGIATTYFSGGKIWYKGKDYFSSFSAFDKNKNELKEMTLYYFDKNNFVDKMLQAGTASYVKDNQWKLTQGSLYQRLSGASFPLIESFNEKTWELPERPADFARIDADIAQLNIKKLYEYINTMEKLGISVYEYRTQFYDQFASSFICILFALSSISAIYHPNRRGRSFGRNVLLVLIFNTLYWPLYFTALTLGSSGRLPPLLASFSIPMLCTLYLLFFFYKNRKVT